MKSVIKPLALLAIAFAVSPAWAINKCTLADGSVTYQEAPCVSGSAQTLKLQPVPETSPTEARYANAIATRKVMVGMTATQARRAWGEPSKINASTGSYGRHEQWVYDRDGFRNQYVYIENGKVTSIQSPG